MHNEPHELILKELENKIRAKRMCVTRIWESNYQFNKQHIYFNFSIFFTSLFLGIFLINIPSSGRQ